MSPITENKPVSKQSGIFKLPYESLETIFRHLGSENVHWLSKIVRVCQAWYTIALPLLYETVEPMSMRAMSRLKSTLNKRLSLTSLIRTLKFPCFESPSTYTLHFETESYWMSQLGLDWYAVYWIRKSCPSHAQTESPVATFNTGCYRRVVLDYISICLLLEWFIEVARLCNRLHTLQIPTVDFKLPKNVLASMLKPVKHLILVQLYVGKYGTLRHDILGEAINVETLTISGAFLEYDKIHLAGLFDYSFFPKLHTLNIQNYTSLESVKEIIKHHGPKLIHITLWPKFHHPPPASYPISEHRGELIHIKRLTVVLDYHRVFHSIVSLLAMAPLTHLEVHMYRLCCLSCIVHQLPTTLESLVITNLALSSGDLYLTYNEVDSINWDAAKLSRLYPALRSLSIFWRAYAPKLELLWNTVAIVMRDMYDGVGITFRMELIPCDNNFFKRCGRSTEDRDPYRWTRTWSAIGQEHYTTLRRIRPTEVFFF